MSLYGRSPETYCQPHVGIRTQRLTTATTVTGDAIDTKGWDGGYAVVLLNAGTFTGASPSLAVKVTEDSAADMPSAADIAGAAFAAITTANDAALYVGRIHLHGRERFLQVSATSSGTITIIEFGVTVELQGPRQSDYQTGTYTFSV